jgi:tripeptide aminopeptidase
VPDLPDVADLLVELAAMPSPPGEERAVADRVTDYLRTLGLEVDEDDCGARIGSTIGNLLVHVPANDGDGGVPIFFCAHLDTVPPDGPIEPVVEEGIVRNGATTILGADNKAAVVVMLEGVRRVVEEGRAHAGIELLFTSREEVGLEGAKAFDTTALAARTGFVYDYEGDIGTVVESAPYSFGVDAVFKGRSAHAGMNPEDGRSAIYAAARAVGDLRLGRVDDETTANIGTIRGGSARNVVPDRCILEGEARSRDERKLGEIVQEMLDSFAFAASLAGCEVETRVQEKYRGYRLGPDDPALRLAFTALRSAGYEPRLIDGGGAADANVFNNRGLSCANLTHGVHGFHSPDEHVSVADLEAMVGVTLALVEAARSPP